MKAGEVPRRYPLAGLGALEFREIGRGRQADFGEWELVVSVASLWELLLKKDKRDALVGDPLPWWESYVIKTDLPVLGIRQNHVLALGRLPAIHRDPFDRILVAQAIVEKVPLVSKDGELSKYGVQVLW